MNCICLALVANNSKEKLTGGRAMIKGCTKRVVVVKDVQSDIFEEAYLIMRPKQEKTKYKSGHTDIMTEANRIVLDRMPSDNKTSVTFENKRKLFLKKLVSHPLMNKPPFYELSILILK